jgi:Zn-dependent M16 (insulinase) family peptidase
MQTIEKNVPPYSAADPALAVGTAHEGFTVTKVIPLPEFDGHAYVMRHDATGARAMWLAIDDDEKSFSIAFKTPPADSTGVFHILEHSVLCGSDRFPVKEPFVNLLKTSMQTFLNALTFQDKTMYPVASTNTADLKNLMDVYIDAVLHPAIYNRPRIFEQEGWHLELQDSDGNPAAPDDPDARLAYNGVVFNEMKGALSDPDDVLFDAINRSLFPNNAYRFESGGDPRQIPQLTYKKFLDTHARHYNLANSYTILYGALDIDDMLAFLNERFSHATDRHAGAPNQLLPQAPVRAPFAQVKMATAPENASVGLAYVIGGAADRERVLATDVLLDALAGSNESPLKRAVLDADLGDDFTATLVDGQLQPVALFQLKGAKPGVAQRFREVVESTCAELATNGIGHDKLDASLALGEFNMREGDWGPYGDGVALSIQAMSSWLYDDDRPVDYLRYEQELAHMRQGLDDGYFERLLDGLVCKSDHCCEVELVPTEEGSAAEEKDELAARKAAMDASQLQAVANEVDALRAEQEAPDSPEALATLPRLTVADIGPAPKEVPLQKAAAPLPCLWHDLPTRRIDYVYHYFDLSGLAFDDLPYVGVLAELLGKLDTSEHSASDLDTYIEANLGGLTFFTETYGRDSDLGFADPKLVVGASSLQENVRALATIPTEVMLRTSFADSDRMLAILTQQRIVLAQQFANSGHSSAMAQLSGMYSKVNMVANNIGGAEYYLFLRELLANWDARKDELRTRLERLVAQIFTTRNVITSFTGPQADRERFWQEAGTLGLPTPPAGQENVPTADDPFSPAPTSGVRLSVPDPEPRDEFYVIPSNVCYVAEGTGPSPADAGSIGTWQVASRMLTLDYLWNEVRVKGGAYGVGFRRLATGLQQYWSYRDPGVEGTLRRYAGAADWMANWQGDPDELDGYIVSVVAGTDAPVKSRARARRQDNQYFMARPADFRTTIRNQELHATAEDLRALAPSMQGLDQRGTVVVFGPRQALEATNRSFRVIELADPQPAAADPAAADGAVASPDAASFSPAEG